MSNRPTPITDAAFKRAALLPAKHSVIAARLCCRTMERELAEAREQRDKLADTLNDLWHNYSLTGAAYDLIEASLAAVKAVPGVEETTPPTRPQFPDNQIVTVGPV